MCLRKLLILAILFIGCEGGSLSSIPESTKQFVVISPRMNLIMEAQEELFSEESSLKNFAGFSILSHKSSTLSSGAQIKITGQGFNLEKKYTQVEVITFTINIVLDGEIIQLRELGTTLLARNWDNGNGQIGNDYFYSVEYPETDYTNARTYISQSVGRISFVGQIEEGLFEHSLTSVGFSFSEFPLRGYYSNEQNHFDWGFFKGSGFIYSDKES